ncbi:hypothetical protein IAR50_004885 [Cryptococcus sp. DSM 104548]
MKWQRKKVAKNDIADDDWAIVGKDREFEDDEEEDVESVEDEELFKDVESVAGMTPFVRTVGKATSGFLSQQPTFNHGDLPQ